MKLTEKTLSMTEGEILRSYKEAKDQKKQLTILAQLNDCPVEVIKMIFKRQGVDGRSFPRERGKKGGSSACEKETRTAEGVTLGAFGIEIRENVRAMICKTVERKAELESCLEGIKGNLAECDIIIDKLIRFEEGLT